MFKQTALVAGLALGLMAGARGQGINPPIAPNLPPPANPNASIYNGAFELFGGASMQFARSTTVNGGAPVNTSDVAGGQLSLRYHATDWNAFEFRIAAAQPTQLYGNTIVVTSRNYEFSGSYVLTVPTDGPIRPFLLMGGGRIWYIPTGNNNTAGALSQRKFAFNYGGGVDFTVSKHFSVRVEYRGLVYRIPDYKMISIGNWNHMPEPDAGIVFHF